MIPAWLPVLLEQPAIEDGQEFQFRGQRFVVVRGIPRSVALLNAPPTQTSRTFGFKWKKLDTFDSDASLARMREWLISRYGDVSHAAWLTDHGKRPLLLDAGCGAGMSAIELFGDVIPRVRYLGVDVSDAVDTARERFAQRRLEAAFLQADITNLPFDDGSIDLIFSEGVLHHTHSTKSALIGLARLLKPGGRFLLYVYRRKGPIREFTDDYIRRQLQEMSPEQAWDAIVPLTRLGIALGELRAEIDVPEPITLLDIPAGRIDVQRLFYWHVAKIFFREDLTPDEMTHINFDWYAPAEAHRQSPEELREWCAEAQLEIEREVVEQAGITVMARKQSAAEMRTHGA